MACSKSTEELFEASTESPDYSSMEQESPRPRHRRAKSVDALDFDEVTTTLTLSPSALSEEAGVAVNIKERTEGREGGRRKGEDGSEHLNGVVEVMIPAKVESGTLTAAGHTEEARDLKIEELATTENTYNLTGAATPIKSSQQTGGATVNEIVDSPVVEVLPKPPSTPMSSHNKHRTTPLDDTLLPTTPTTTVSSPPPSAISPPSSSKTRPDSLVGEVQSLLNEIRQPLNSDTSSSSKEVQQGNAVGTTIDSRVHESSTDNTREREERAESGEKEGRFEEERPTPSIQRERGGEIQIPSVDSENWYYRHSLKKRKGRTEQPMLPEYHQHMVSFHSFWQSHLSSQ